MFIELTFFGLKAAVVHGMQFNVKQVLFENRKKDNQNLLLASSRALYYGFKKDI